MWRPNTLHEALEAGEAVDIERVGRKYACPNCGCRRHAAVIIDTRALPIPEDWACDVCWTHWERIGRSPDSAPTSPHEWRGRWAKALGAPDEVRRKLTGSGKASEGFGSQ